MSEYEEMDASFCPECGERLRDSWRVPLVAAPKTTLTATLLDEETDETAVGFDGHVTVDTDVRVYLHDTGVGGDPA